jgi:threonine dehydratase
LAAERDRMAGKKVAVIQTGGNVDSDMLVEVLGGGTPVP